MFTTRAATGCVPLLFALTLPTVHSFISAHLQIQDGMWNEWVNAGRIRAVKGSLAEVLPAGVRLADGTAIDW